MTTPVMQPMAYYGSSTGYVQVNTGSVVPTGGYVTAQTTALSNPFAETYRSQQSKRLGITLVVIACLAFIFNIVGFIVGDDVASVGHGFWCGIPFMLTGSFGIAAANKRRCFIITFMVLAIFTTVFSIPMFFISLSNLAECGKKRCHFMKSSHCGECNYAAVAMEVLLATIAAIAFIVSIWSSVICCAAVCCGPSPYGMANSRPYGNQQVIVINQPHQQLGAVQMPMNFQQLAYPAGSVVAPQQQYWVDPSSQQQYPPQQSMPGYTPSAPIADETLPDAGPPVTPPPAYSTLNFKGPVN